MQTYPSVLKRAVCAMTATLAVLLAGDDALSQAISGVSGSLTQGSSVILSGSSFGTKATAAPIKWADFESGTQGTIISTSDGWQSVDGWNAETNSHSSAPMYDSAASHAGTKGMTCRYVNGVYNSSVLKSGNFSTGFYLDAWYRYAPAAPASRNHKIFMLYGTGVSEFPQAALTGFCNLNQGIEIPFYAGPNAGDAEWTGLTFAELTGTMKHLQVWIKPSTPGVSDGRVWMAVDGVVEADATDKLTVSPNVGYWDEVRIGYYMAHDAILDCAASGDAYTYWDNVYIDNTQARVELGNATTYAACTHREIQVPTAWSASQISFNFNAGTFGGGESAYLYVVTADGAVSSGYPVTLGGTVVSGPGQPGKPVF